MAALGNIGTAGSVNAGDVLAAGGASAIARALRVVPMGGQEVLLTAAGIAAGGTPPSALPGTATLGTVAAPAQVAGAVAQPAQVVATVQGQ